MSWTDRLARRLPQTQDVGQLGPGSGLRNEALANDPRRQAARKPYASASSQDQVLERQLSAVG